MATQFGSLGSQRPATGKYLDDQVFFVRFGIAMVALIVAAFFQWEARGLTDLREVPWWVHVHAALMVAWLGLSVAQNLLARGATLVLHRKLGWAAAVVVAGILASGVYTGVQALALHRVPPFFSGPQFLALTIVEPAMFALLVAAGIAVRKHMEWHRRLMMGATIVILEPAFGRLLPMPLLGIWGEWVIMAIQLGFVAVIARHDLCRYGREHPATLMLSLAVVTTHTSTALLAAWPPFAAIARATAGI